MRKFYISFTIAAFMIILAASTVLAGGVIKFGTEIPGTLQISSQDQNLPRTGMEFDTKMGFFMAGECFFDVKENLDVGVGVEYQFTRKTKRYEIDYYYMEEEFNYIPIYVLGRYQINSRSYLTGKVGYNFLEIKDISKDYEVKGGLFLGFGGGSILEDAWQIEVLYSINNGGFKIPADEYNSEVNCDWKYSKIGVSVGYKF